jgi:dihydrodipicolinate synthase/N-acetylneuraminate lyase
MKEAQVLMGKFEDATVRPPLMKLPESEVSAIKAGLVRARFIRDRS